MFNIIKPTGNGIVYYDIIPELKENMPGTINDEKECEEYILSYCTQRYAYKDDIYVLETLDMPMLSDNIWTWYKQLKINSTVVTVADQVRQNIELIKHQLLNNRIKQQQ